MHSQPFETRLGQRRLLAVIVPLLRRFGIVVRLAGRGLWQTGKILAFGRLTSHRASTSKPESVECAALQLNEGLVILRQAMDTRNVQYMSSFPELSSAEEAATNPLGQVSSPLPASSMTRTVELDVVFMKRWAMWWE
uniref:Uncharacterized protein n=1 Tax=Echinococcus granulosus TaxID=6210 RepID=A0A068WU48_ECHGR|nr:hypothetical protein EgrG_002037800 [Echinococcus granulosus]